MTSSGQSETPSQSGNLGRSKGSASSDLRPSGRSRRSQDLGELLRWSGIALLGTYAVTVAATALPVKLLDPAWINRMCGSIRGGVSFPLEAMLFILIGAYLRGDSGRETPLTTNLRRLCIWVSVGFVLMIPLQTWAGQKLIAQAVEGQQARIAPAVNALRAVYAATNAEELLAAINTIPGAPPNISGKFEEPVPKVRERLISQIEPQVRQQQEQLKQLSGEIRNGGQISLVKDGFVALFSAIAFAAIGRSKPYRPTLLQTMFGAPRILPESSEEFYKLAEDYSLDEEP